MSEGLITNVDVENRLIECAVTFGMISHDMIFSYEASKKAFLAWYERSGNVLEMFDMTHPLGRCINLIFHDEEKQALLRIQISNSVAENLFVKVQKGLLSGCGFSYIVHDCEDVERDGLSYPCLTEYEVLSVSLIP